MSTYDKKRLCNAAEFGDLKTLIKILNETDIDLNERYYERCDTILHSAISEEHYKITEYLLGFTEIDVNIQSANGCTPVYFAAMVPHFTPLLEIMLTKLYGDANIPMDDGSTPLFTAAYRRNFNNLVTLIRDGDADVNAKDYNNTTPLMRACKKAGYNKGFLDGVEYLLDSGANIDDKDNHKRTALYYAADNNYTNIVTYLVENGANVNKQDILGESYLHIAAKNNNLEMVKLLLKHGATFYQNNKGKTPYDLATTKEMKDIMISKIRYDERMNLAFPLNFRNLPIELIQKIADLTVGSVKGKDPIDIIEEIRVEKNVSTSNVF